MKIKNRLWAARKELGLTQKEVAIILKRKSPSQVSRWEKGKRIPQTKDLLMLAALYNRFSCDLMHEYYVELRKEVNKRYSKLKQKKAKK